MPIDTYGRPQPSIIFKKITAPCTAKKICYKYVPSWNLFEYDFKSPTLRESRLHHQSPAAQCWLATAIFRRGANGCESGFRISAPISDNSLYAQCLQLYLNRKVDYRYKVCLPHPIICFRGGQPRILFCLHFRRHFGRPAFFTGVCVYRSQIRR